jgi:predicted nucleotide-binding protein
MKPLTSDITTLLKTKFDHIAQECESETRTKVASIYSSIKYENGRLNVPNFDKVANILVGVIRLKEKRFNSELSRIFTITHGSQNVDDLQRGKELILSYFQDDQYLNRFDVFVAGVERIVSRCGGRFDRKACRTDMAAALFSVGVKSSNRRAISSVQSELDLHMALNQPLSSNKSITKPIGQNSMQTNKKVFIGHGRSLLWRELKDFLHEKLHLEWEEFNREPAAGVTTIERLQQMLDASCIAFLVMTAEDQHADTTVHARENVIHEVGLFQGKLGFRRAIVVLEEGCTEFSNIVGLNQLRFPNGNLSACFEEVRRVLEREGIKIG